MTKRSDENHVSCLYEGCFPNIKSNPAAFASPVSCDLSYPFNLNGCTAPWNNSHRQPVLSDCQVNSEAEVEPIRCLAFIPLP